MKTRSSMSGQIAGCMLALLVLSAGTDWAQADAIYDFNGLSNGSIETQDGWVRTTRPDGFEWAYGLSVTDGPAASADTTKVVVGPNGAAAGSYRTTPTMYFTSADTAVEQKFWVSADPADSGPVGGVRFAGYDAAYNLFGVQRASWNKNYFYYRNGTGNEYLYGNALLTNDWYELKLVMDFSVAGGAAALYSRDVTTGQTTFTQQQEGGHGYWIINMGLTPDAQGRYAVNGFGFRMDVCPNSYVDNFSVSSPVPEPGTLALLASGLIGLLAYVWRKRQ